MEEQHHSQHKNDKKKRIDYDDIIFVAVVFLLISLWAYMSNSIALSVVAVLAVLPSIVRPLLPRTKQQKVKIDVDEDDDAADGKPEPSHLMADILWMLLIIVILVVLSATGSPRYVTSDERSHRYETCPDITTYRDMNVYSFPIDVWLLHIKPCETCRLLRVEERRANAEAESLRKKKEEEQQKYGRRRRLNIDDDDDEDDYYYYYDDEEDDDEEY